MFSVSQSNSTYIFCPPLPGKPNSREPYDPSSGKSRSRVIQKSQKENACGFYALQLLRNEKRIGKFPLKSQLKAWFIEKSISNHRKEMTKIDQTLKVHLEFAKSFTKMRGSFTKTDAVQFQKNEIQNFPKKIQKICCAFDTFCKQNQFDEFSSFTKNAYLEARMKVHETFFCEIGVSSKHVQNSVPKILKKTWEELSLFEKEWHEQNIVFLTSYMCYGANISLWGPEQPIERLIEQLRLYGPHLIKGNIGQAYYEDPPFELPTKLENRSVFGWKPNSKRRTYDNNEFHAVIIVGANSEKQHVYFIDPLDESDPNDISTQKIYAMSYERLKSSIASLGGIQMKTEQGTLHFSDQPHYALHF